MTDYRSILLALCDGRTYTQITAELGCSRRTISHARTVLDSHALTTATIRSLTDAELEILFPDHRRCDPGRFIQPDFEAIAERRKRRTRVTHQPAPAQSWW